MADDIGGALSSLGSGIGGIGSAIGDFYAASGSRDAAAAFETGAGYATENAELAQWSTNVQEIQAQRKVDRVVAAQQNAQVGAGFTSGGTGLDLLRDSTAQGHLTTQMIGVQGQINENSYLAQSAALEGESKQAKAAAAAQTAAGVTSGIGGILGIGAGILKFFL